jgi:hypothetical protein
VWAWPSGNLTGLSKDWVQARTEALRIGLTGTGGAGAAFALLLAFRRQRATEHDATERRVTELYAKVSSSLGTAMPQSAREGCMSWNAWPRITRGNGGRSSACSAPTCVCPVARIATRARPRCPPIHRSAP